MTLLLRGGEKLPARVVEHREHTLLVAIVIPCEPLSARRLEGMVLEYANPGGRLRLRGRVTREGFSGGELLRIEQAQLIEVVRERAHMRVPLSRPVTVEEGEEQTHTRARAWPAWRLAEPSWRASALYRAGFSTSSMRYPSGSRTKHSRGPRSRTV